MKHKCLHIIKIAFGIATVLSLWSCSSNDSTHEPVEAPKRELHFMLGSCNYQDVTPETSRRALPEGYVLYSELTPKLPLDGASLRCFITQNNEVVGYGNVSYNSGSWVSAISQAVGVSYIYGLMAGNEASNVTLTPQSDNFENGASMVIEGLNPLINSDICTIVGVKGATADVGFDNVDIKRGGFAYDVQTDGTFIYLLIDHLYAALQLNMNISSEYNALRTIKLTKLTLRSSSVTKKVNMTVNLTPNISNTLPFTTPTLEQQTSADAEPVVLYDGAEKTLEETNNLVFVACTAPMAANTQFEMTTTYNVYDRKGNLIRKDCEAKNVLKLTKSDSDQILPGGLAHGQKYTFNLTVNPTYLNVLSDPDLDNPTITIGN